MVLIIKGRVFITLIVLILGSQYYIGRAYKSNNYKKTQRNMDLIDSDVLK